MHHLNIAQVRTRSKGGEDIDSLPWSRNSSTTLKYRAEIGLDGAAGSAAHVLNLMAEKRRDRGYAPASSWASEAYYARDIKSLAAEYRGQLSEAFSLQAGLRRDMNTAFDDFTAWNIAGSWRFTEQIRVHASAGRAAVAPTFGELYNVTSNWQGNPYLTPEISTGADIGVEWISSGGRRRVDVTAFWQEMENEIVTSWASSPLRPENDPRKMRARGIELQAEWSLGEQLAVGAGYTWQQAQKQDGTVAVRRPRHELGLTATWTSADRKVEVSGNMRLVAGNYDYNYIGGTRQPGAELGSSTTFNLAGSYALNDQVKLTARVQNLFDRKHSDVLGYRAQERAVWVGVNANF